MKTSSFLNRSGGHHHPCRLGRLSLAGGLVALLLFLGCPPSRTSLPPPCPEPPPTDEPAGEAALGSPGETPSAEGVVNHLGPEPSDLPAGDLVASAQELYSRALARYVAGEEDEARQDFTDASLAVELAAELTLSPEEEEELGLLQSKIAFFLEQLGVPAAELIPPPEMPPGEAAAAPESLGTAAPVEPAREIAVVMNPRVEKWLAYFQGKGSQRFQTWLERSGRYRDLIAGILREEGLPEELIYLALIESGMNPRAYSWAHAVGMWQFIGSTARIYGLQIDWWIDERRDPVKSCRAACRHLKDLYTAFDDWPLALAAYNSGQRRVEREVRRRGTKDFWKLRLPRQTRDYVPKFMAAVLIGRDPERYGFSPRYQDPWRFDTIQVEGPLSFELLSRMAGSTEEDLKTLNPELRQGAVPPKPSPYPLRVSFGRGETCLAALASLTPEERKAHQVAAPAGVHVVRRGETLSSIALRYGTTVTALAEINGLRNRHLIRPGQRLDIPGSARLPGRRHRIAGEVKQSSEGGTIYVVRRGDTVYDIARHFGVPMREMLALNGLTRRSLIHPGDELLVSLSSPDRTPAAGAPVSASAAPVETRVHVVRRGDTVYDIARLYGISMNQVLRLNGLGRRSLIHPGDELLVPAGGTAAVRVEARADREDAGGSRVHVVRRGDTVYDIARRYGTPMDDILRLNGLGRRSLIRPGDRLLVPEGERTPAGDVRAGEERSTEDRVHVVRRGDTVYDIAHKYGITVSAVERANDLRRNQVIRPGDRLAIPARPASRASSEPLPAAAGGKEAQTGGSREIVYTVKKGDTLDRIARRFGTRVADIRRWNGMSPRAHLIRPGDKLHIHPPEG